MPTGAAGDDFHVAESLEFLVSDIHFIEEDFAGFLRDAAEQGIAHRAGLLENFLLHEMLEAALFGHDRVPANVLGRTVDDVTLEVRELHSLRGEHGDFAIAEEKHAARVRENSRNVAGDEKFMIAKADDDGWSEARGNDFVGIFGRDGNQRVGAPIILTAFSTASSSEEFFENFSSRWAMISVSVSVWNLWPSVRSCFFRSM